MIYWLVTEPTHLKIMSQIGNLPQIGMKIKNLWNHHLDFICMIYDIWYMSMYLFQVPKLTSTSWELIYPLTIGHKPQLMIFFFPRWDMDTPVTVIKASRPCAMKRGGPGLVEASRPCGRMDGWMDGWMDGCGISISHLPVPQRNLEPNQTPRQANISGNYCRPLVPNI